MRKIKSADKRPKRKVTDPPESPPSKHLRSKSSNAAKKVTKEKPTSKKKNTAKKKPGGKRTVLKRKAVKRKAVTKPPIQKKLKQSTIIKTLKEVPTQSKSPAPKLSQPNNPPSTTASPLPPNPQTPKKLKRVRVARAVSTAVATKASTPPTNFPSPVESKKAPQSTMVCVFFISTSKF